MSLLNKEAVKRAAKKLKEFDKNLFVVELENSAKTAVDAANSLNCDVGAIVKSLLIKVQTKYLLCLVAGDKRCSLNKLKNIKNEKNVKMASPAEVKSQTGYTIGGVSPIGHINEIEIFIDNSLSRFSEIYAAAGHPNVIFKINFKSLKQITNAEIKEITEWNKLTSLIISY